MNKLVFLSLILGIHCTNTAQLSTNYNTIDDIAESYMDAADFERTINAQAKINHIEKLEQECKLLASAIEQLKKECNQNNNESCDIFFESEKKYQKKLIRLAEIKFGFNVYLGLANPYEMQRIQDLFKQ